jgi:plasmid stabilization system protein ParE
MKEKESASKSSESTSRESTGYRYEFAPRAVRDFDEAMAWLTGEASREIAERWAHALNQKIYTLTTFPERCQVAAQAPGTKPSVRAVLRRAMH